MPRLPATYPLRRLCAGLLVLLATIVAGPGAFGQTALVGYSSISGGSAPTDPYPFFNHTPDTIIVIPFAFNSLGDYTLTSTSLLLRAIPSQGGTLPVGHGSPDANNGIDFTLVSVQIFSSLPSSLTLPTPLLTFSTLSAGAPETPVIRSYTPTSAPTFTAGQTYYLAIGVGGTLQWDQTTGASSNGTFPGNNPITTLVSDGTPMVYYEITSSGAQGRYANVGGFALTATAHAAIPEPADGAILTGAGVLAIALMVRQRRRRFAGANQEQNPGG